MKEERQKYEGRKGGNKKDKEDKVAWGKTEKQGKNWKERERKEGKKDEKRQQKDKVAWQKEEKDSRKEGKQSRKEEGKKMEGLKEERIK